MGMMGRDSRGNTTIYYLAGGGPLHGPSLDSAWLEGPHGAADLRFYGRTAR